MKNINRYAVIGLLGLLAVVLFLANMRRVSVEKYECKSSPDNAFVLSPGAMCKGDPYLYSGNDAFSRMCQSLLETEEGRLELGQFNCATGFDGIPRASFPTYTSHSNSLWQDIDCSDLNEKERVQGDGEVCGY